MNGVHHPFGDWMKPCWTYEIINTPVVTLISELNLFLCQGVVNSLNWYDGLACMRCEDKIQSLH